MHPFLIKSVFPVAVLGFALSAAAAPFAPASPENTHGMQLYRSKDYAGAADAFRAAIAADPKLVVAHYNLACVEALQNHRDGALAELTWLKQSDSSQASDKLRRARIDPDLAAVANDPEIRAILDGAAYVPKLVTPLVLVRSVTATSTLGSGKKGASNPSVTLYAVQGDDPDGAFSYEQTWCENKPGEGIGEGITIKFATPTVIDQVAIAAGDWRSREQFNKRNKVTEIELVVDGGEPIRGEMDNDSPEEPWVTIDVHTMGTPMKQLMVRIAAVEARGKNSGSCITVIELRRNKNRVEPVIGGGAIDDRATDGFVEAVTATADALFSMDAVRLDGALVFPFEYRYRESNNDIAGIRDKPFKYKDAATLHAACGKASPRPCPGPFELDDRDVYIFSDRDGEITVRSFHGMHEDWHFVWQSGHWKLRLIDSAWHHD